MDYDRDVLSPLPPRISSAADAKRARRQSPFVANPSFVSGAIVPSPRPAEVISSLIDSLTAISESAREQLKKDLAVPDHTQSQDFESYDSRPRTPDAPLSVYSDSNTYEYGSEDGDYSDGEVAAAPTVRFVRTPPKIPRRSRKENRLIISNAMRSAHSLVSRRSYPSAPSQDELPDMNMTSKGWPSTSTNSTTSFTSGRSPSPHKINTPDSLNDQTTQRPVLNTHRSEEIESLDNVTVRRSLEQQPQGDHVTETFLNSKDSSIHESAGIIPGVDAPIIDAPNPPNNESLRDGLIPMRRSSIRRNTQSSIDSIDVQRHSMGSRDLKDLNIDSELIESNDSTVQRIRELQEARERRQKEWRKEARRSEKAAKRQLASSPRAGSRNGMKMSITEVVIESPELESDPKMSACINAADLASMPALGQYVDLDASSSSEPASIEPSPQIPPPIPEPRAVISPPPSARTSSQWKRASASNMSKQLEGAAEIRNIQEEVEAFLSAPRLTQRIRHPRTGRTIAFSEVGHPDGFVVFCCVGMGLTRYVTAFYDELARTLKLRLITPDRPGVGESEAVPERLGNPLTWVDDVAVICETLAISRFSLLAHSAGSIYALAIALKMPQYVRGRIHLLAPWIPPSQMPKGTVTGTDLQPVANLPISHRLLSVLPTPVLKVANSRFLSGQSALADSNPFKQKKGKHHLESLESPLSPIHSDMSDPSFSSVFSDAETLRGDESRNGLSHYYSASDTMVAQRTLAVSPTSESRASSAAGRHRQLHSPGPGSGPPTTFDATARQALYNQTLTHRIWALSTHNANPAVDLMICLERRRPIGFRYAEVTRSVVIHHGAKDTRVPLDNARWLTTIMKRCELRILYEEGHGLMASASVMSSVLTEIGREWEEWQKVAKDKEKRRRLEEETVMGGVSVQGTNGYRPVPVR